MDRYLKDTILSDALASRKMAFISGPRQVGKTTLGETLVPEPQSRFNWDDDKFKLLWSKSPSVSLETRAGNRVLLDEIHKDRLWKSKLKGIFDLQNKTLQLIVTGSARLDHFRKGGDSLLGRYIPYRLHPFTLNESENPISADTFLAILQKDNLEFNQVSKRFQLNDLLKLTGFPEPLLGGNEARANRWSRQRIERIVSEDVRDFRNIYDLQSLALLVKLLPTKVGSTFSVNSLRQNLSAAYATVRDWVGVLESLYIHFSILPFSLKMSRMLTQEPKIYLYDGTKIADRSLQLENLCALHLHKSCQFWTDSAQGEFSLHYLRNKEKQEVDFCVVNKSEVLTLIECKTGDINLAPNLIKFSKELGVSCSFQLVDRPGYHRFYPAHGIHVVGYDLFFSILV